MDPCLFADPFVVSGWVKTDLVALKLVRVTKSGLVIIVYVSAGQREKAPELFCSQDKGAIERSDN